MQAGNPPRTQLEGKFARRALVIVPAFPPAQESDHQRVVRADWGRRAEVFPGLGVEGQRDNTNQGEGRRETPCWRRRRAHHFIVSRWGSSLELAEGEGQLSAAFTAIRPVWQLFRISAAFRKDFTSQLVTVAAPKVPNMNGTVKP